jgi:RimJ/RimL family protein N-acetyltransferase
MPPSLEPVTLIGRAVRLEPLGEVHVAGLVAAGGLDPAVWQWTVARPMNESDLRAWVADARAAADAGRELPFAAVDQASGQPIGSSRYLSIVLEHRRLEIGWTWVVPARQGSAAKTEAELLMLEHAVERLECRRVEFKTHAANERSRAALLGIGATFEGVFRKHMVMPGDGVRDSAYYSVIDNDWPRVRANLEARVARLVGRAAGP